LNIVFVHSKSLYDQYQVLWRCNNIARAIEKTGYHHATVIEVPDFIANNETCNKVCSESDLIVIHRYCVDSVLRAALYWKAFNKKLVLDMDEAVNLIPMGMGQYNFWNKGDCSPYFSIASNPNKKIIPPPVKQLSWATTLVDAITVSSHRLAGDWEGFGRIWEVPDYINFDQYLTIKPHRNDEIWIGMGGSAISPKAFKDSGLIDALEKICQRNPHIHLFLGNMPSELMQSVNISNQQKVTYSWLPPEDWVFQLSNLDIGLALAFSEYDLRFSRNRVLEYMATRIPWIASDHLPYRDLKSFGMLVENTKDTWYKGLMTIIDSLPAYQKKAESSSYVYAVSQDIDENIHKILKMYEIILNEK
jgi:hypothetical protein